MPALDGLAQTDSSRNLGGSAFGPRHFVRIVSGHCTGRAKVVQAPAPEPEPPIDGDLAVPTLLVQALVTKYCDHTSLYRQSKIFARHGVDLERSTLAGWVGGACWWLEALHDKLFAGAPGQPKRLISQK